MYNTINYNETDSIFNWVIIIIKFLSFFQIIIKNFILITTDSNLLFKLNTFINYVIVIIAFIIHFQNLIVIINKFKFSFVLLSLK